MRREPIEAVESIYNSSGPSEAPIGAVEAHVESFSFGMEYILQNWTEPFENDQNEDGGDENQNRWDEVEDVGDIEGQTEMIEKGTQTDMTPSFPDFRSRPEGSDRSEIMKGCVFGMKMMRAAEQTDAKRKKIFDETVERVQKQFFAYHRENVCQDNENMTDETKEKELDISLELKKRKSIANSVAAKRRKKMSKLHRAQVARMARIKRVSDDNEVEGDDENW